MNERDLELGVMGQQVGVEDMVPLAPSEIVEKEQVQARKTWGKHLREMLLEVYLERTILMIGVKKM
jgi:hypothetical protein